MNLTDSFCVEYREEVYEKGTKGTFDIFSGIEHRMRKEELEEQFNKEAKQGWRSAADAARMTDETARSEDRKHTSGEGVVGQSAAILEQLLAKKKVRKRGFQETKEQLFEEVCGFLSVYFWHSKGSTQRDEALMGATVKQVRTTRRQQKAIQPADPKGPNGEFFERTCDCVIASHSLQGKIKNMGVVEDFESRPHSVVTFLVE